MRVQVNLATRPFVELRPFFLRLRLWMAALALLGIAVAIGAHVLSARAARQQAQLDRVRDQTIAAQQSKLRTEQRMRQPANAAVLDRAHFLNALFLRKSFSWTAVMMDLENVLPTGVQVTSIEPAVSADGTVIIRSRVGGERDRAVQLVRNLEHSRRFLEPRLGSESAQKSEKLVANGARPGQIVPAVPQGPPSVEFEILATYNPLPPGESYGAGHGRGSTGEEPGAKSSARSGHRSSLIVPSTHPAAHVRGGFPASGVVLPPYGSPQTGRRSGLAPTAPAGAQAGGGPR